MSDYYDRDGSPMTLEEWATSFEGRRGEKKRVAETTLDDGRWISTVWLGINHNFNPDGPPLIFETMAFASKDDLGDELGQWRYTTEEEAAAGHDWVVAALETGRNPYDEDED